MSCVGVPTGAVGHGHNQPATAVRLVAVRLIAGAFLLWALIAGLGLIVTQLLARTAFERWDGSVDSGLAKHRSDSWNAVTHLLASMAETLTVIAIGLVFFVGMRIVLGRWRESLFLAVTLLGEVTIFLCATLVIHRRRPAVSHLDSAPPTSSFPSGHTAASVALYVGLAAIAWTASRRGWLRTLAAALAIVAPIAVAFARLYRGMHYPTDVAAGALLGLLWLGITAQVLLVKRR